MMDERSCPDESTFQRLLEDTLSENAVQALTRHLDSCVVCQGRLDAVADESGLISSGTDEVMLDLASVSPDAHAVIAQLDLRRAALDLASLDLDQQATSGQTERPAADGYSQPPSPSWTLLSGFLDPTSDDGTLGSFGSYEVLEVIGEGGMGVVVKARDTKLQRIVAIKIISPVLAANTEARQRFLREARSAGGLHHENIVTLHAVSEWKGIAFLVLRYIEGPTLHDLVQASGPLPAERVFDLGRQIAHGLAAAHQQGLVHRDIKPSNILVEQPGERICITDFGLARSLDDSTLTRTGIVAGTPQFMSPEQAAGKELDERSDLFSLGSVLYFLSSGQSPFEGPSTLSVLRSIQEVPPRSLRELNPQVPHSLQAIIERLMERDPDKRFQTAAEVADVLDAAGRGEPIPVWRGGENRRVRTRRTAAILLSCVAALVIAWGLRSFMFPAAGPVPSPNMALGTPDVEQGLQAVTNVTPNIQFQIVGEEERFDSLYLAVRNARYGDVIEILGDGVYQAEAIDLFGKSLTIQAAPSSFPIIELNATTFTKGGNWIRSDSDVTIRNLEVIDRTPQLDWNSFSLAEREQSAIVFVRDPAMLTIEQCRFKTETSRVCVYVSNANCQLVDTLLVARTHHAIYWVNTPDGNRLTLDNCAVHAPTCLKALFGRPVGSSRLTMRNTTLAAEHFAELTLRDPSATPATPLLLVDVTNSLFDLRTICQLVPSRSKPPSGYDAFAVDPATSFQHLMSWIDRDNYYTERVESFLEVQYYRSNAPIVTTGPEVGNWLTLTGQNQQAAKAADVEVHFDWPEDGPVAYQLRWGDKTPAPDPAIGANLETILPPGMLNLPGSSE